MTAVAGRLETTASLETAERRQPTRHLRRRYLWHRRRGTNPRGALALARAEEYGASLGWFAAWNPDPDYEPDPFDFWAPRERARWANEDHACEWVGLYDDEGGLLDAMVGIWDADAEHRREVVAEMMRGAMNDQMVAPSPASADAGGKRMEEGQ